MANPAVIAQMVAGPVNVILVGASTFAVAAEALTRTIPFVMAGVSDPVELGLIASLAHPGGNVTGGSRESPRLAAKKLELMKVLLPSAARIGVLVDSTSPLAVANLREMQAAATSLGLELHSLQIGSNDGSLATAWGG